MEFKRRYFTKNNFVDSEFAGDISNKRLIFGFIVQIQLFSLLLDMKEADAQSFIDMKR